MLGISEILEKYPSEVSGGQKQRSAAARALVHEPAIILGDEPTGALDSKNAKSLLESMTNLNEEQDVSIMMVTMIHLVRVTADVFYSSKTENCIKKFIAEVRVMSFIKKF